jgi:hypothetical protein
MQAQKGRAGDRRETIEPLKEIIQQYELIPPKNSKYIL